MTYLSVYSLPVSAPVEGTSQEADTTLIESQRSATVSFQRAMSLASLLLSAEISAKRLACLQ